MEPEPFALPWMTRPWKILAVAVAVFGFVYGYVGTAGSAVWACASMGQCLQWTLDRGFPGFFYPAALGPGAGWALLFGAVAYVLFLTVFGIRKAFHWERQPQVQLVDTPSPAQPAFIESVSSPVATAVESHTPASANAWRTLVRLLAVGALAFGILSVGPSQLSSDLGEVIPRDTVTAYSCPSGYSPVGSRCSYVDWSDIGVAGKVVLSDPGCYGEPDGMWLPTLDAVPAVLESDGMCHLRSGGDPIPLVGDVLHGGLIGLLAFLAIGAALLLWSRRQAASLPSPGLAPAPPAVVPTSHTLTNRLRQLQEAHDAGLISDDEFSTKRSDLLRGV